MILNYYQMQSASGSGGDIVAKFYDLDGSVLYQYTKSEFNALTELPENPTHTGLVAQGWNWTLSDAQAFVEEAGFVDIGQNYNTSDGKTHIFIETVVAPATAYYSHRADVGVTLTIDWGDGSTPVDVSGTGAYSYPYHSYANIGEYEITVSSTGSYALGYNSNESSAFFALVQASWCEVGYIQKAYISTDVNRFIGYLFYRCGCQEVSIPNSITSIGDSTFSQCDARQITIPRGCSQISTSICAYSYELKSVSLPNTISGLVTSSGAYSASRAFYYDSSLEWVNLTSNFVTNDDASFTYMFEYSGIKNAYIPPNMKGNFFNAFLNCGRLKKIVISSEINSSSTNIASNNKGLQEFQLLNTNMIRVPNDACNNCYGLSKVVLSNSIRTIGTNAFARCYALSNINSNHITYFSGSAFYQCWSLDKLDFNTEENITFIGEYSFYKCPFWDGANITFPSNIVTASGARDSNIIGANIYSQNVGTNSFTNCKIFHSCNLYNTQNLLSKCFEQCNQLTQINIPSTILSIGANAFNYCQKLKEVHIAASTPPTLEPNAFQYTSGSLKIYIPTGSLSDYQSATNWSSYSSKFIEE